MEEIFEIIRAPGKGERDEIEISLGIRVKLGGHETICPVTKSSNSYETLEREAKAIKDHLDKVMARAREMYQGDTKQEGLDLKPDMSAEEIWAVLSRIEDMDLFVNNFNNLDEDKRKEVAEHVLTRCNIFSGKASIFSSRYDNESGFLE